MYFKNFPYILYTLDDGTSFHLATDILRRVNVIEEVINNIAFYETYDIQDGETPEIVADKFYGNPYYHWVILLANNIIDPILDWPMSQRQLELYASSKYPNIYATHHYEDVNGFIVTASAYPVSNIEYEEIINESKRGIKIPKKAAISSIISEFKKLIKE